MNRTFTILSISAAFVAGCAVTHVLRPAIAAENITAQVIHVPDLMGDALGPPSVQDGNVPKHLHPNANEVQYILEGTGTIWLGEKEVRVKPGDLVIIPKGTPHGGTKPDGRTFKAIAIKTPPQTPDDVKMLN
jgi:mannose-6-phosphate isomerase-like protein (cupin superfamily)